MIYEYPEDFIVPIAFVEDLVQEKNETVNERDILIIGENWKFNKMNSEKIKDEENNEYEKHKYNYDMIKEFEDNGYIKTILNDIDEEYSISETLAV